MSFLACIFHNDLVDSALFHQPTFQNPSPPSLLGRQTLDHATSSFLDFQRKFLQSHMILKVTAAKIENIDNQKHSTPYKTDLTYSALPAR